MKTSKAHTPTCETLEGGGERRQLRQSSDRTADQSPVGLFCRLFKLTQRISKLNGVMCPNQPFLCEIGPNRSSRRFASST